MPKKLMHTFMVQIGTWCRSTWVWKDLEGFRTVPQAKQRIRDLRSSGEFSGPCIIEERRIVWTSGSLDPPNA